MGLDINAVQFLIAARQRGADFGDVLTLGRQDLNVYPAKMRKLLESRGLPSNHFAPEAPDTLFAEAVFKTLGAKEVFAMDVSKFEGAAFVHDLNKPIESNLRERFDVVYDGGTLEHVFNFPLALQNCMEMVRTGGRLFIHTGTNGYCGHGFYQFSPELFFRALSPENGFEIERMVAHRMGPYGSWYEVSDPECVRSRVELITYWPIQLLVQARRTSLAKVFDNTPQQSDYTLRWTDQPKDKPADTTDYSPSRPKLAGVLPGVARLINVIKIGFGLLRSHSLGNRKCFRPVKKP